MFLKISIVLNGISNDFNDFFKNYGIYSVYRIKDVYRYFLLDFCEITNDFTRVEECYEFQGISMNFNEFMVFYKIPKNVNRFQQNLKQCKGNKRIFKKFKRF